MISSNNKNVIIGIVIIVSFLVLAFNIFPFLGLTGHTEECSLIAGCPHEQELDFLQTALPLMLSFALLIGAGTYYLMAQQVESKEKSLKKNTDVILKLLNSDEKKLVNLLLENKGKILQAEVTRLPGMTKVKSHRVVQKLIDRGVLEKESVGKTNVLKFTEEIKQGLL
ncbi:MAG: hypothetical protein NUV57_01245 [archaeon]|nr:hypothetical protein [archaeon]